MRRTRNLAELATRLRELADAVEAGTHTVPPLGVPASRVERGVTVPSVVHDLLCGWRIRIPTATRPHLMACTGCGLTMRSAPSSEENAL